MRLLGNLLWFFVAGLWLFFAYVSAGVVQCLTIIGIPFGIQSFKLAIFADAFNESLPGLAGAVRRGALYEPWSSTGTRGRDWPLHGPYPCRWC